MTERSQASAIHPPVAFLDRTYDEALGLTRAARDCIAAGVVLPPEGSSPSASMVAAVESMRLTTRITQVMAWCLAQKAIFAGEVARDAATVERFSLGARELCLGEDNENNELLSEPLRVLLAKSRALYIRVLRLDDLMHREVAGRG
jgi:regulator of CtrA degradation